jgi:AraC-like DNA-binding protein
MAREKIWLQRLDKAVSDCLQSGMLTNEALALAINLSERQLFRKVKKETGMSPRQYTRKYRLNYALNCLKSGRCITVKQAATEAGYVNVSYFISEFEKEFGSRPFEVLQKAGWR